MLSQRAMETVLGVDGPVALDPEAMAEEVEVTFYPRDRQAYTDRVAAFAEEFTSALEDLGVQVRPYEDTLTQLPRGRVAKWTALGALNSLAEPIRALFGDDVLPGARRPGLGVLAKVNLLGEKVEPGVSIVALGEGEEGELAVDHTMSFRETSIITLLDLEEDVEGEVREDMPFQDHFDRAMEIFGHHMTNIALGVDDDRWMLYNFNASHPFFDRDGDLRDQLLHTLIPKLAAPIRPPQLSAFEVREQAFDPTDDEHRPPIRDLVESGSLLEDSGLYPPGKELDSLPWRNSFYRWAGKIHLDDRTGMSYGFLARQMPTELSTMVPVDEAEDRLGVDPPAGSDVFEHDGRTHLVLDTPEGAFCMAVPDIWVMTLRSGSDKTDPDPETDLVKLGLSDGQMIMETPEGLELAEGYRPSFDTKVILAHSVGNAILASALDHLHDSHPFADQLREEGLALAHWHGYLNPDRVPEGWHVHGATEAHVSCGTPQSAIYALRGKLRSFREALADGEPFRGDVHIEPHHGTNIVYPTLEELGRFLTEDDDVAGLGNTYLDAYKEQARAKARAP